MCPISFLLSGASLRSIKRMLERKKERKKNSDGRAGPLSAHSVDIHMNVVALLLLLLLSFGRPAQQQIEKKAEPFLAGNR